MKVLVLCIWMISLKCKWWNLDMKGCWWTWWMNVWFKNDWTIYNVKMMKEWHDLDWNAHVNGYELI